MAIVVSSPRDLGALVPTEYIHDRVVIQLEINALLDIPLEHILLKINQSLLNQLHINQPRRLDKLTGRRMPGASEHLLRHSLPLAQELRADNIVVDFITGVELFITAGRLRFELLQLVAQLVEEFGASRQLCVRGDVHL